MEAPTETTPRMQARHFWLGLGCLLVSVVTATVLAGRQLDVLAVPGCGEGSACDQAAASVWGKVPLLNWPVSFAGLAYFAALLAAWIAVRFCGAVPRALRNLVRLGACLSAMFMVVMIVGGYACPWCIAVHVGNFGFLFVLEFAPVAGRGAPRALGWATAAFVAASGVELAAQATVKQELKQQLDDSMRQITEGSPQQQAGEPFTGRHLTGPANAAIRMVIISDYQCPDCKLIESQARAVLAEHDNVSMSAKHFPFCTDCNPYATKDLHPNACWAARAAEAAGILRGNDGFWEMHRWLFDRGGWFKDHHIRHALGEFGYDARTFLATMQSEETLRLVQADIEEAKELGLFRTPMIFINGVELKGWVAVPDALVKAVRRLAATNPPPGDASQDRPPTAFEKYVADWRDEEPKTIPADTRAWTMGPGRAAVDVVVWGDYQEPLTARVDGLLRGIAASRGDVRYTFRHYPIDHKCNPALPAKVANLHPLACLGARAAEAAGTLAGSAGYWAMHEWLFENMDRLSKETLAEAAIELGLDPEALLAEMQTAAVGNAIAEDALAAKSLGLRGVPFIHINNKHVPRWKKESVLEAMIEEAAAE
jgi:protein-disulfide isomerase